MASPLQSYIGIAKTPTAGSAEDYAQRRFKTASTFGEQGSGYAYDPNQNAYFSSNAGGVGGGYYRTTINPDGTSNKVWVPGEDSSATWAAKGDPTVRALDALKSIGGSFGGGGSADVSASAAAAPARVQMRSIMAGPNAFGAQNAAFAGVKARAGALARSGLETLRSNLAERGLLGGGTEARGVVSKLAEAINPESDYNTAALGENVKIAQQNQALDAQAAGQQFSGDVAQRGQDISVASANANRALDAAKFNAQKNAAALSSLMSIYGASRY